MIEFIKKNLKYKSNKILIHFFTLLFGFKHYCLFKASIHIGEIIVPRPMTVKAIPQLNDCNKKPNIMGEKMVTVNPITDWTPKANPMTSGSETFVIATL